MLGGMHSESAAQGDLSSESGQEAVEDPGVEGKQDSTRRGSPCGPSQDALVEGTQVTVQTHTLKGPYLLR